jgi:hypothetical protein
MFVGFSHQTLTLRLLSLPSYSKILFPIVAVNKIMIEMVVTRLTMSKRKVP